MTTTMDVTANESSGAVEGRCVPLYGPATTVTYALKIRGACVAEKFQVSATGMSGVAHDAPQKGGGVPGQVSCVTLFGKLLASRQSP